jgi:hypothetical protein
MTDYTLVLNINYPDSEWTMIGNDLKSLIWMSAGKPPTQAQLDAAWPQTQYKLQHAAVEAQRRARYQAETDGLFFEAQRGDGNLDAWKAATAQIRADLPYPEQPA